MRRLLITIIAVTLTINSYCQNLVLDHTMIRDKCKLSFPMFIATDKKYETATASINDFIQLQSLHKKISNSKSYLFEDFEPNSNCNYEIYTNSKTLLSLKIESGYPFYFNFNTQNGRLIELNDLFKGANIQDILKMREKVLEEQISHKVSNLPHDKTYDFITTFFDDKINRYYEVYYVKDSKLYLHTPNGNAELEQNKIDTKLNINWTVEIDISDIENILSDLGKKLLFNTGDISSIKTETSSTKFLKGKIDDKYPVTMILNLSYNEQTRSWDIDESFYWYDKIGIGLYLIGGKNDDEYSIEVFDLKSRTTKEFFKFRFDNNKYIGQWKDLSSGKELKFQAVNYFDFGL